MGSLRTRVVVAAALFVGACNAARTDRMDAATGTDASAGPEAGRACPQNWTREHEEPPYTSLLHVSDGALVMEGSAMGVSVQTPLTSEDSGANVMRFEFSHLVLGPGAEFRLAFHDEGIAEVVLTVTDAGAHLSYPPILGGLEYDLRFSSAVSRATIELHQTDEGLRTYAYFFSAGDNRVLTGVLPRGNVHAHLGRFELRLVGITARAVLERYVNYEEVSETAYADDFDCDSLAQPNRLGWSPSRTVPLGAACVRDADCGSADACVDGRCRRPCFSSRVCGNQVCLAHPSGGGYCRLESEARCSSGVCPAGLVCGVDSTCRRPCEGGREAYSTDFSNVAGTCGLNFVRCDDTGRCVETSKFRCVHGACADDDERGAAEAGGWGCGYGAVRCSNDGHQIEQCNVSGPGFQRIEMCGQFAESCSYVCPGPAGHEYLCATGTTSRTPRCSACRRVCERGEDVLDYCSDAPGHVVVDCETGFSWCSTGPGGDITRRRPGDLPYFQAECESVLSPASPPARIAITPPSGSGVAPFHIDRTEVSRAQYIGFLQSRPRVRDAPAACRLNTTLLPGSGNDLGDWPWFERPDRPAIVDWCDAWAYCQWAGGHLCGALAGGAVSVTNVSDPAHGAWTYVCTVGGTRAEPYGAVRDDTACDAAVFPYSDVGTHPRCTSAAAGFAGVMDQPGNAPEWMDACTPGAASDGSEDTCVEMGGADCVNHVAAARLRPAAGIRCCYP